MLSTVSDDRFGMMSGAGDPRPVLFDPLRRSADSVGPAMFFRRRDLVAEGVSDRRLRRAVDAGQLLRPRAGLYLQAGSHPDVVDACHVGGRVACMSEAARRGIFVLDTSVLHLHVPPHSSDLRRVARPIRVHWGSLHRQPHPQAASVELFDALLQAVRCQPPRAAIATLDSALNRGALREDDLDELFGALPRRYRRLRPLLDARSESGPETFLRLILRSLGVRFELQVVIDGVGRVDFLVDGWLIIECDSRAHHSDWESQRRDRRRDQAAAALGLATFRPIAEDIMWSPDAVRAAIQGLIARRARR